MTLFVERIFADAIKLLILRRDHSGLTSSVQLLGHVQLFETPGTAALQVSLSITNSWSLLKLMSIESVMVMPSNHLILCRLSPSSAFDLSQHQGLF